MAVYSQNGYEANNRDLVSSRPVPGTTRRLTLRKGPAGDLLLAFAGAFDRLVENIDAPQEVMDDWGYAERPIRGGTELSNHASGTAEDLNAIQHPLGTRPEDNYSPAQIAAIRKLLKLAQGCIRWGGDYVGRKDPMHFEIVKGEAACRAALANFTAPEEDELRADERQALMELWAFLRKGHQAKGDTHPAGEMTLYQVETLRNTRKTLGELAALRTALTQHATAQGIDMAAVEQAAQRGAEAGVQDLEDLLAEMQATRDAVPEADSAPAQA